MKKKTAKWLLSKLTPYKEIITLDTACDDYAELCCNHYGWPKFVRDDLLSDIFVAISHSFMNGYILCMHQNDLTFENGLILKDHRTSLPGYMEKTLTNQAISDERDRILKTVETILNKYDNRYNVNEIVSAINKELKNSK